MTWLLGLMGLGGVASAVASAVSSVIQAISPALGVILSAVAQAIVWFAKEFWKGLGVILSNLSTLAVIAVIVAGTAWYTRDYQVEKCEVRVEKLKKEIAPPVRKPQTRTVWTPWPWEWF